MEEIGTGAGQLTIRMQIGSVWIKDFYFRSYNSTTDVYTDDSLTGATFSFFLKKFKGDRLKIYNLTLGSGVAFITYSSNAIRVTASASQQSIEEGEYYYELRRTDLDKAKVSGVAILTYDSPQ
tara:strand:- start:230 stop:598 length:369 start_codon:yes stop_codon:yes gene_type:complete